MNNKLIVCFPLEIKQRELFSKLYLSYLLLKTKKIDIVIGDKKFFLIDYEKSKNLISEPSLHRLTHRSKQLHFFS